VTTGRPFCAAQSESSSSITARIHSRAKLRSFSRSSGVSALSANLTQSRANPSNSFAADDMGLSLQFHSSTPIMHFSAPSSLVKTPAEANCLRQKQVSSQWVRPIRSLHSNPTTGIPRLGRVPVGGDDLNPRQKAGPDFPSGTGERLRALRLAKEAADKAKPTKKRIK
jgi:hypothetical protein